MEQEKINNLLNEMTLAEKIGQLVQLTPDFFSEGGEITGPMQEWQLSSEKLYQIGSVLGTHTAQQVYTIQQQYLEKSRLPIPLVFMADVIHGYETIYPIPLALSATFDEKTVENAARLAAKEAAQAGIHVTFSPMADYVKDARWGRVLESNGEDPTLSSRLTAAYVRGYQGENLATDKERIAACVKHFVGYGAAQGGRDYNTVDFSDLEMYQNYLPAFQAAIDAGAELVMTAFNTVRGIPATANQELLQDTLRSELGFEGVVISDWAAVAELIAHRVASDKKEAAELAFSAGVDMDMMSDCYLTSLAEVLSESQLAQLDQAVLRILNLKNKLGLFEDPYRGLTPDNLQPQSSPTLLEDVRMAAEKSAVLLKNSGILPLNPNQKIGLIGPKATSQDILGAWSWIGKPEAAVSLANGLSKQRENLVVLGFEDGKELSDEAIHEAKEIAKEQDVVILAVGETSEEAGEAASLADIRLSRNQEKLIHEVASVNENVVLVVFSGRPLVLTAIEPKVKAILEVWFPGSQGGHAIANLLTGAVNPQGKLPMSFPRSVGQLPYTYAQLSTGRPKTAENADQKYISRYMDEENHALYPFGYGLSYSQFSLSEGKLSEEVMQLGDTIDVSIKLQNESDREGTAVLQLYVEDVVTKVARPMRELKDWQLARLQAQENQTITFTLTEKELRYIHSDLVAKTDVGTFNVYVGLDSQSAEKIGTFEYVH